MTKRIWEFSPWLPYEIGLSRLVSKCRFVNSDEVFSAGMTPGRKRGRPYPIPQLELKLEDFSIDCFMWESVTIVSEKMREVLDQACAEVEYFDIDSSRSSETPRSMNYKVMNVTAIEDISFPSGGGDILSGNEFLGGIIYDSTSINIFSETRAQVFHDRRYIGSCFCTDSLAVRVLQAGCSGVRFLDPENRVLTRPMHFRTLRGIEEEGSWDPIANVERTILVDDLSGSPQ